MKDILVVGHYTQDLIIHKTGRRVETLGGPPAYIYSILKNLDVDISIVSKVGEDFRYFDHIAIPKMPTVTKSKSDYTIMDYSLGERKQKFTSVCDSIFPEDITKGAKVAIISGVIGEVLPETIEKISRLSRIVLADIQGFIRFLDKNGDVFHKQLLDTKYSKILGKLGFLKASKTEIMFVDIEEVRKTTKIIVTQGASGCTIFEKEKKTQVPGFFIDEIDSTGSGDAFLAGFSYALLKGKKLEKAAKIGNLCGSVAATQTGVPVLSEKDAENILSLSYGN